MRTRHLTSSFVAGLVAIFVSAGAVAEDYNAPGKDMTDKTKATKSATEARMHSAKQVDKHAGKMTKFTPALQRGSEVIGMAIKSSTDADLGSVNDLILNVDYNRVEYAVIASGGILGIGQDLRTVPWRALKTTADGKAMAIKMGATQFRDAPKFLQNSWPNVYEDDWQRSIHTYYEGTYTPYERDYTGDETGVYDNPDTMAGRTGAGESATRAIQPGVAQPGTKTEHEIRKEESVRAVHRYNKDSFRRLSNVIGLDLNDRADEDLGSIKDVVIDTSNGRIAYAVVSSGGAWGIGDQLSAVPWSAVTLQSDSRTARLNASADILGRNIIEPDALDRLEDLEFARTYHQNYEATPYWERRYDRSDDMGAWRADSDYNKRFQTGQVKTIEGTVQSVSSFKPDPAASEGVQLQVRTNDGETVTVQAGPRDYSAKKGVDFKQGEKVKVTGRAVKDGAQDVIIATRIENQTQNLDLRDAQGRPLWDDGGRM